MKRLILALALLLVTLPIAAQTANIDTPVVATETNIRVNRIVITADLCTLYFDFRAADGTVKRTGVYHYTDADLISFLTALGSARATETGTVLRRLNFRVVGWMKDGARFRAPDDVTPLSVTVAP